MGKKPAIHGAGGVQTASAAELPEQLDDLLVRGIGHTLPAPGR
jgi:hypothetical protein